MATSDFRSLGLDRLSQNIKRAVTAPVGNITTGDLSKGTLITVDIADPATSGTATVAPRRTGALLLGMTIDGGLVEYKWSITDTTLTVTLNGAADASFNFWVF